LLGSYLFIFLELKCDVGSSKRLSYAGDIYSYTYLSAVEEWELINTNTRRVGNFN
jgi:hypothetical protein